MWTTYTPAMQQYIDFKKQYNDCILFFRLGDFYEIFFEDAKLCSKLLDLVLTSKNKNSDNPIPMVWVPHHSVDKYITKMVNLGYKIAIAEQITNPMPGKLVEREVISVITPWTYIKENQNNFSYIAAVSYEPYKSGENYHLAWWDFTIGEYSTKSFENIWDLEKFLAILNPVEIILDIGLQGKDALQQSIKNYLNSLISIYDIPVDPDKYILEQCKIQTLASFGQALQWWRIWAFALLLHYIKDTQKDNLKNIIRVSHHTMKDRVLLDEITIKNLEIFSSNYEHNDKYSLAGILDNTKTNAGARLLRSILMNPIKDKSELKKRVNNIEYYIDNLETTKIFHTILGWALDLQKIVSTILYKKVLPWFFVKLRFTLGLFFENNQILDELKRLGLSENSCNKLNELYNFLKKTLKNDEYIKNDMDFIADWVDSEIDELRKIAYHSDEMILDYQQELAKLSWIVNVKLKFVMNQWYFIEITNKDIETFETNLAALAIQSAEKYNVVKRNTLKWWQRYSSEFLDSIQEKVLSAREWLASKEFAILNEIKNTIWTMTNEIYEFANVVAWFDLYTSHAIFASENNLVKAEYIDNWELKIKNGRHLVIEKFLDKNDQFIPNDLVMNDEKWFLHVVTWPNMGGKSTFLRQNALIVLMTHCGLYVPASQVQMPIIDWIFARVGSGDVLAKNQSTFMTEMVEVANILNNATKDSFIIFDELGRGTSTYDWLALTKAILEYVATQTKAKTLIATHYHELIEMEKMYDWVKNYSVSVYETEKEVVFMKKIVEWWASKSYGLDVAKIAWIPAVILQRAGENLEELKATAVKNTANVGNQSLFSPNRFVQVSDPKFEKIKNIVNSFDINNITPLQALQLLAKVKDELK